MVAQDRKIKVVFLVGTLARGGAERQLLHMLEALAGNRVDARVLGLTTGEVLQEELEDLGIPVEYVGRQQSRLARMATITASLRRHRAEVVHASHFYANLYAGVAGRASGAVSIGSIRSDLQLELQANGIFGWGHLFAPRFLVVNSEAARARAASLGRSPSRLFLIENAVDTERFSPRGGAGDEGRNASEREDRGDSHLLRVLLVGRLVPEKRVDRFIRLVETLASAPDGLPVEARVVGDGRLRGVLEEMACERAPSKGTITFLGEVADTRPHYEWADVLLLTSDNEGTPNVVLEAMAFGLPVIATAVGGLPRLLGDGGGILVPPGDEAALAGAVRQLVANPMLAARLAREGRRRVRERSGKALGKRLYRVYLEALGEST